MPPRELTEPPPAAPPEAPEPNPLEDDVEYWEKPWGNHRRYSMSDPSYFTLTLLFDAAICKTCWRIIPPPGPPLNP
jgi:hypothetical protein